MSETEPELGLGTVRAVTDRVVTLGFAAAGEARAYALDNAPLRRVRFRPGDRIQTRAQGVWIVQSLTEHAGLIHYHGPAGQLCETELSDTLAFNRPTERLLNGVVEESSVFDLRFAALRHQHRRRLSPVRGFTGGRIDLLPHQLYLVAEVAGRLAPRVLLADEVGLGKTIEACLIVHRLLQTGRVRRALILVPEPLIHQWFVELLRRFNLWFHLFDEERCASIEAHQPDANPFFDDQLVLCSVALLANNERRRTQALAAGWDIVVVDEAHHLGWSPESVSPEYALVEALSRQTPGLLLLTATPEQLGMASHFARLRLLDPDRYSDLAAFTREAEQYRAVADMAGKLLAHQPLTPDEAGLLAAILKTDAPSVQAKLTRIATGDAALREQLLGDLIDQHGPGRVMFRNTRAAMTGSPQRTVHLEPLAAPPHATGLLDALADEFAADTSASQATKFAPEFDADPRVAWLVELLRREPQEKVLLICRTQAKVLALDAALRKLVSLPVALFHEGLPLVQRDRNAAWFAEADGARLLLCSEIGGEGRNFQFAHHLVLFDLPFDPELLEQRIGRLDRIGQTAEIHIHVPFTTGSAQEVLARWYDEGINACARNLRGGRELLERFGPRVHDLAQDFHETQSAARAELAQLIAETRLAATDLATRLEQGRDRLLELNSFRPELVAPIIQEIRRQDADRMLENFLLAVFDQHGLHVEELSPRTYRLGSAGVFADSFPGLPANGLTVTADRSRALVREEVQFLSWDHPLVTAALDLLLGADAGNSSVAHWPDLKVRALYLEAVFVLECIAPPELHVDRFLPPTPVRVLVDHTGKDESATWDAEAFARRLKPGNLHALLDLPGLRDDVLPAQVEQAEALAQQRVPALTARARAQMNAALGREIARLTALQRVNPNVRPEEITALAQHQTALATHLQAARLRLDAVRLIRRGPG
ncbi:MAG: hypothetical protein RL514_2221 [Verrucomicrobiota bacterium]|jgi:ATP-dependent helicase HepA